MLVGSLLIIKLLKQLIKQRGEVGVNQIGYRLPLMYAAYGVGSERPRLIRNGTRVCQEQFVRRQPASFFMSHY